MAKDLRYDLDRTDIERQAYYPQASLEIELEDHRLRRTVLELVEAIRNSPVVGNLIKELVPDTDSKKSIPPPGSAGVLNMKCPHCHVAFHWKPEPRALCRDKIASWYLMHTTCPMCERLIVKLLAHNVAVEGASGIPDQEIVVFPRRSNSRPPCPPEVPESIAKRYNQACLILQDSPEAGAALARRCLQQILREEANVKAGNLADEIAQVLTGGKLPATIAESIEAIRHYGNFAAHPTESVVTGEIIDVEDGEAEAVLITLEALFDVYYVSPAKAKASRAKLNAKLREAGKKELR